MQKRDAAKAHAYYLKWYALHKEEFREKRKQPEHKAKMKAYLKTYYQENKEAFKRRASEQYKKNR